MKHISLLVLIYFNISTGFGQILTKPINSEEYLKQSFIRNQSPISSLELQSKKQEFQKEILKLEEKEILTIYLS